MKSQFFNITPDKKKWITIAIHVLIWLAIFLLPYILNPDYEPEPHGKKHSKTDFRDLNTVTKIFWLALFYFNAFILVPRLVYKRKFILYVLSLLGLFGVIMLVHGILFHMMIEERVFHLLRSSAFNAVPFAFTIILSTAYQSITDQLRIERLLAEKQNENLKTELSFLRSQISPHFLFNVMNNIVAMVRLKSDELESTVMKLSSIMQYMLYETDEERVLVKSEAEYLQNYIDLQKQRFGPELTLNVLFDIKEDWHTIEPMLLIPFVENAFKHGSGLLEHPQIEIQLNVVNNHLHFMVKNKYKQSKAIKDKTSGIGLTNVKRRLELLYSGSHILTIDRKNDWFTIYLHLTLK